MMKEYEKPQIAVVVIDSEDIIMTSDGNDLLSGTFNTKKGVVKGTVFKNEWASGVYNDQ